MISSQLDREIGFEQAASHDPAAGYVNAYHAGSGHDLHHMGLVASGNLLGFAGELNSQPGALLGRGGAGQAATPSPPAEAQAGHGSYGGYGSYWASEEAGAGGGSGT